MGEAFCRVLSGIFVSIMPAYVPQHKPWPIKTSPIMQPVFQPVRLDICWRNAKSNPSVFDQKVSKFWTAAIGKRSSVPFQTMTDAAMEVVRPKPFVVSMPIEGEKEETDEWLGHISTEIMRKVPAGQAQPVTV